MLDRGGPHKDVWVLVGAGDVSVDGLGQSTEVVETAAANAFLSEMGEPSFDEIQPGTGSGSEVQVKAGGSRLEKVQGNDDEWNNLARNYFEAVGMLGAKGEALRAVIEQALNIMGGASIDRKILFRTRFNAARCLARLHRSAPAVYCDHVTRAKWDKEAIGELVYGYAVRGFHQRTHRTEDRPPELLPLFEHFAEQPDPERQSIRSWRKESRTR